MINRKFNGPSGRATKFSHPRATMSVIVVMFIAEPLISLRPFVQSDCWTLGLQTTDANKTSEAYGCSLLRPRRVSTSGSVRWGSRCVRQRLVLFVFRAGFPAETLYANLLPLLS